MIRSVVSSLTGLVLLVPLAPRRDPTPIAPRAGITLSGTVTAAQRTVPLANASVSVGSSGLATVTGSDGQYQLLLPDSLRGRSVAVSFRAIGYQLVTHSVQADSTRIRLDVSLQPAPLALQQVVVTGTAQASRKNTLGAAVSAATVYGTPATSPAITVGKHGRQERDDRAHNTESYDRIRDNVFRSAREVPLSTFSIDVDRASYANVRRFITQGQLPPKDAVRLEELVNYFSYEYAQPSGPHPVHVTTDVAQAPWAPQHRLVRIALQAQQVDIAKLPPSNLVFLIDVSGSMSDPNKLPLVKQALYMLTDQLREDDHVAIVVYAGAAGLVLPSTSGTNRTVIRSAIERLEAGGSTAGGAGIQLAYKVAKDHFIAGGNNRVILATDGDFNVGASSDSEMERLIEEKRKDGTFLTVLGFGMGNYKDAKLEKLADKGNGNYAYVDSPLEARKVFVHEFGGTLLTVAKDVKLQVEFNPRRVKSYRLLGYENRLLNDEDFADDTKDAGDMGAGHTVTALYEVVTTGESQDRSRGSLRYQEQPSLSSASRTEELLQVKLRYKTRDGSTSRELRTVAYDRPVELAGDFAFASAVAEFAMLLRDAEHKGKSSIQQVLARAEASCGADAHGYRRDFIAMVRSYDALRHRAARSGSPE